MTENTPTSPRGPLSRLRAWLRGDRYMVDSQPAPAVVEPAAAPAPAQPSAERG